MSNYRLKASDPKIRIKVDSNPMLFHLRYIAMKDFHIEAYKVFKQSKNNQDNIFNLLEECIRKEVPYNATAATCLSTMQSHNVIIKSICDLRDKYYAHLDSDYKDYLTDMQVSDVEKCLNDLETSIIVIVPKEDYESAISKVMLRDEITLN